MALKRWKRLNTKIIFQNKHWSYNLDDFEIESAGRGQYHYVHTLGSTMVIPFAGRDKIILVNQFRYLNQKESLEFPCGGVETGLSVMENAIKELREETGYSCNDLLKAGEFSPYTGASDELCSVFIASGLFNSPLPMDSTEEFEIVLKSFDEINKLIEENVIWDGLTISAWTIAAKRLREML